MKHTRSGACSYWIGSKCSQGLSKDKAKNYWVDVQRSDASLSGKLS